MRATLAGWRNALLSPVTDAASAKARNMRSAITTLLRGAAHAHRPDWEMAALESSRDEGHAVKVFHREPDGRQVQSRFAVRTSSNTDSAMTQALPCDADILPVADTGCDADASRVQRASSRGAASFNREVETAKMELT